MIFLSLHSSWKMSCLQPVFVSGVTANSTFTPFTKFASGFLEAGQWDSMPIHENILKAVVLLQFIVCIIGYIDTGLPNNDKAYEDKAQFAWQAFLALLLLFIPDMEMSGPTAMVTFLHAVMESLLFISRVCRYFNVANREGIINEVYSVSVVMLIALAATDNPIVKFVITTLPAFVSDVGNPTITLFLFWQGKNVFSYGHVLFAWLHLGVFHLPLITTCLLPKKETALIIILASSLNLFLLFLYMWKRQEEVDAESRARVVEDKRK